MTAPTLTLRPRESEILALVAQGLSNADIGHRLFITEDTVKTHLRWAFKRLGARDRAHAVALAAGAGLISLHTTCRRCDAVATLLSSTRATRHRQNRPDVDWWSQLLAALDQMHGTDPEAAL